MSFLSDKYHICVVGFGVGVALSFCSVAVVLSLFFQLFMMFSFVFEATEDLFVSEGILKTIFFSIQLLFIAIESTLLVIFTMAYIFFLNRYISNLQSIVNVHHGLIHKLANIHDDNYIIMKPTMLCRVKGWVIICFSVVFLLISIIFTMLLHDFTMVLIEGEGSDFIRKERNVIIDGVIDIVHNINNTTNQWSLSLFAVIIICFVVSIYFLLKRKSYSKQGASDVLAFHQKRNKKLLVVFLIGSLCYGSLQMGVFVQISMFYVIYMMSIRFLFVTFISSCVMGFIMVPLLKYFMAVMTHQNQMLKDKIDEEMKVDSDC